MVRLCSLTLVTLALLLEASALAASSRANRAYKIDEDTPEEDYTTRRFSDGATLSLVFSDEFETPGRSFAGRDDAHFEAIEKPDYSNQAIQFYNASREYVTTRGGDLVLTTRAVKTTWPTGARDALGRPLYETKNYTSGMVQTWNRLCFTGGVLELSIKLPGHADSGGLWPAAWLMGNLARAGFDKTSMFKWPWSYDSCGRENGGAEAEAGAGGKAAPGVPGLRNKQEINACDANPGFGLHPHQGRGAPEIDIFEVMPGHEMPGLGAVQAFMSSSLQVRECVCMDIWVYGYMDIHIYGNVSTKP